MANVSSSRKTMFRILGGFLFVLGAAASSVNAEWCDPAVSDLMQSTCECKHPFPTETGWAVYKDSCVLVLAGACAGTAQYQDVGPLHAPRDTVACEMRGGACVPKASAFPAHTVQIGTNNCRIATADDCNGNCGWEKLDPPFRFVSDSGCELKKAPGGGGGSAEMCQ